MSKERFYDKLLLSPMTLQVKSEEVLEAPGEGTDEECAKDEGPSTNL